MRVSVIGTGYVGLVSGACLAEVGHDCVCVDIDPGKVARINRGEAPIHEAGLDELLARHVGSRLRATTDLHEAVHGSELTIIAVGTPFDGSRIDLSYIRRAAEEIGAALRTKSDYHVVVVKSTVVPGTTDDVVVPALEQASGKRAGRDFGVGMNPEFLTEGVAVADFMRPDRIVIGGLDERTRDVQRALYAAFPETPVVATNNRTAEAIKYASNAVLATLISFSNEIANVCSAIGGIDAAEVMKGVHLARYFSSRCDDGTVVRAPITSFLWAGCGYGGSCLPKDTQALSAHAAAHGQPMPLLDAVIRINADQPSRMIGIVERHFGSLAGLDVTVLGLAFKEGTDDVRESPAIPIIRTLVDRGARVAAYDPIAVEASRNLVPATVRFAATLDDAVSQAKAVLLVTRWDEFRRLTDILGALDTPPLLVDGRRMLDRDKFTRYDGIGL